MKYLILWKNNGRIASVPLTKENLQYFNERYCLRLIQRDNAGTEHYEVFGKWS